MPLGSINSAQELSEISSLRSFILFFCVTYYPNGNDQLNSFGFAAHPLAISNCEDLQHLNRQYTVHLAQTYLFISLAHQRSVLSALSPNVLHYIFYWFAVLRIIDIKA